MMRSYQKSWSLLGERLVLATFPVVFTIAMLFIFILFSDNTAHRPPESSSQDPVVDHLSRSEAIKSAFDFAWDGYYTFAFPHDELMPVTNLPGTSRNDWGATAVDALGTAILMEKWDVVKVILAHVQTIDFHHTNTPISVFESTIRYMGGLLSAYELLTGPFAHISPEIPNVEVLLNQAKSLADVLSAAFIDGNALPSGQLDPTNWKGNDMNSLTGAGTLVSKSPQKKVVDVTNHIAGFGMDQTLRLDQGPEIRQARTNGRRLSVESSAQNCRAVSWTCWRERKYHYWTVPTWHNILGCTFRFLLRVFVEDVRV
jgi:Glycosyl hydrolase family 47